MEREVDAPERVLRPRDHLTFWVTAETWHCAFCEPAGGEGAGTTVDWLDGEHDGPDGRCRVCGAKYRPAPWGERVPTPHEQHRNG